MGLLQALALEALGGYFPGLDLDNLRVNLLRGRVDMKDVDLTPGQVFTFLGFPFQLSSGKVGVLGVHFPWASIYSTPASLDVRDVELHFHEIVFPQSQSDVFQALQDASRREKNRKLAESERAESAITLALQKFLPILLDRVEARISRVKMCLHFATGEVASFSLEGFQTISTQGKRNKSSNRADFVKTITVEDISCCVDSPDGDLLNVDKTSIRLNLDLGGGVFNVDAVLPQLISVQVAVSLGRFLVSVKSRISAWAVAKKHQRPNETIQENPRAWFQYAVRIVRERAGLTKSAVSIANLRAMVPILSEYKRLHVRRLRKNELLKKGEEDRITHIEDSLDSDMILLLRRHARSEAMAEEVSAFATKDWLRWALFDYQMSAEREYLAQEIRKSLAVIDGTDGEEDRSATMNSSTYGESRSVARGWSKANVLFMMKTFCVHLQDQAGDVMSLSINSTSLHAKLDSSLQAYGVSISISEILLSDKGVLVFHRSDFATAPVANPSPAGLDCCLQAKVQKSALDQIVTLSVHLAPLSIQVVLDRIPVYAAFSTSINDILKLSCKNVPTSTSASQVKCLAQKASQPPGTIAAKFAVQIDIPEVEIILRRELWHSTNPADHSSITMHFSSLDIHVLGGGSVERMTRVNFHGVVQDCQVPRPVEHGHRPEEQMTSQRCASFRISSAMSLELSPSKSVTNISDLKGSCSVSGVISLLSFFSSAYNLCWDATMRPPSPATTQAVFHSENELSLVSHQNIINCVQLEFNIIPDEATVSSTLVLTGSGIRICDDPNDGTSVSAQVLAVEDTTHHGVLTIAGASRSADGLQIQHIMQCPGSATEVDVKCDVVRCSFGPRSICTVLGIVSDLNDAMILFGFRKQSANSCMTACEKESDGRISMLAHSLSVEVFAETSRFILKCQNLYAVSHRAALSGSLDIISLMDASEFPDQPDMVVLYVPSSEASRAERRAITFHRSLTCTSLHFVSLQFTLHRARIDRIVMLVQIISDAVRLTIGAERALQSPGKGIQQVNPDQDNGFSVEGSDLSFILPLALRGTDGVCLETSSLTITHARGTLSFLIRKLSVLTSTAAHCSFLKHQNSSRHASEKSKRDVMVRDLDLDFNSNLKSPPSLAEFSNLRRSEWKLQILSKAAFFITPGQLRMLQAIPHELASNVPVDDGNTCGNVSPVDAKPWRFEGTSALSEYEHWSLIIETQTISVELLNEDQKGIVISTIACLELGPVDFSLRQACEKSGLSLDAVVTRWTATSSSFRLEDGFLEVPLSRREVVSSSEDTILYPESLMIGSGLPLVNSVISAEGILRNDERHGPRSSFQVVFQNLRVAFTSTFVGRLIYFISQCSDALHQKSSRSDKADPFSESKTSDEQQQPLMPDLTDPHSLLTDSSLLKQNESSLRASQKITVKLLSSVVRLFERGVHAGESSVLVEIDTLSSIFALDESGYLLTGSQVSLGEARLSMTRHPIAVFRPEGAFGRTRRKKDSAEDATEPFTFFDATLPPQLMLSSIHDRHMVAQSASQQSQSPSSESIGIVRGVILKLPVRGRDRFTCLIGAISLDSSIGALCSFLHLVSTLDVIPELGDEGTLVLSPIQLSLNGLSARIRIPMNTDIIESGVSPHPQTVLRAHLSTQLFIGGDLAGLTGSFKFSADAVDEKAGVRDNVISPCTVELEVLFGAELRVSLIAARLLRFVVSPLTLRTLTALALHIGKSFLDSALKSMGSLEMECRNANRSPNGMFRHLSLSIYLRGLALSCVAEDPRVQLMRLSIRDLNVRTVLPLFDHEEGECELTLQEIVLEDTVSWRFTSDDYPSDAPVRWTTLFSRADHTSGKEMGPHFLSLASPSSSAFPEAPTNFRSERNPSTTMAMFRSKVLWRSPFDRLTGFVNMAPFQLNADMGVVPHLKAWLHSVLGAISEVHIALKKSATWVIFQAGNDSPRPLIGIDHVVIGPIVVTVSAKAPPRRITETASRRLLMWLFGLETSVDNIFQVPEVVMHGNFDNFSSVIDRMQVVYVRAIASQRIGRQLFSDAPSISRLLRVFAMSVLRSRPSVIESESERAPFPSSSAAVVAGRYSLGLREAISSAPAGIVMNVTVPSVVEGSDGEILDLTSSSRRYSKDPNVVDGKTLFRRLRQRDERIPKNDRFEFFAPYSSEQYLLLTSFYVLIVSGTSREVQEPLIRRSSIIEYHLAGRRITIVSGHTVPASSARSAARRQSRDTSSLAIQIGKDRIISEITMYEIECTSPQYASWLRSQLPNPKTPRTGSVT